MGGGSEPEEEGEGMRGMEGKGTEKLTAAQSSRLVSSQVPVPKKSGPGHSD